MARRRPAGLWPALAEALAIAVRAFPDDSVGMGDALIAAFRDGEIPTQGHYRGNPWNPTGVPVDAPTAIPASFWHAVEKETIDWGEGRCTFRLPTNDPQKVTIEVAIGVEVYRPCLDQWIGRGETGGKAAKKRRDHADDETGVSAPPVYGARLRRAEASRYLKEAWGIERTANTLAKLAVTGGGPPFEYDGRTPLYPKIELDQWAQANLSPLKSSTSDPGKGSA
jgi:hypothetical protein